MKTLQEKIAVMQAAADGKEIEACYHNDDWGHCQAACWDWVTYDYRVKPEPRKVYFVAHNNLIDTNTVSFVQYGSICDEKDIAAGYSVVEFIEVPK